MHIAEGILSGPVVAAGAVAAAGGVAVGLARMDARRLPRVAIVSSAFYVASLIHVPGPVSVHLLLNGLAGLVLGWAAFPALLVALLLQSIMFGYGGLSALGVNTVNMALPAVVCGCVLGPWLRRSRRAFAIGFAAGVFATLLSAALTSLSLLASGGQFMPIVYGVLLAHVPVMIVEGLVTGTAVEFLRQVRPELLDLTASLAAVPQEASDA